MSNNLSELIWEHRPSAMYVDRSVTPLWYIVGVVGNILSATIWTSRRMRNNNSSVIYLSALSISDLLFLVLHVIQELQYAWQVFLLDYPIICECYQVIYMITQYLSPTLILAFTVERYISVCHPFRASSHCFTSRALKAVAASVIACTLLASIHGYLSMYDPTSQKCITRPDTMNSSSGGLDATIDLSLWAVWTWTTELTVFLVIPIIILIFNLLVIFEIRRMSQHEKVTMNSKEQKLSNTSQHESHPMNNSSHGAATTVMLLSVSFYMILTTLPATLAYVLYVSFPEGSMHLSKDLVRNDPIWTKYFQYILSKKIVDEICLSHYACNFILYLITGVQFRIALIALFKGKLYQNTYSE